MVGTGTRATGDLGGIELALTGVACQLQANRGAALGVHQDRGCTLFGVPTVAPMHEGDQGGRKAPALLGQAVLVAQGAFAVDDLLQHVVFHETGEAQREEILGHPQFGLDLGDALVAGAWLAVVDVDTFGVDAATELGVPLERVVRIDTRRHRAEQTGADQTGAEHDVHDWIDVMGPDGEVRRASPGDNTDLFARTTGGMGLTGVILRAALRLRPVETAWIRQTTIPAPNLARAMEEYDTLGDFLEHVSLVMDNDTRSDEEKVTIMTMHGAKGLEFNNVFLPGWEEGVFPSQRSLDEGGLASLEEERRLAYVAITRARRRCTILHAANRRIYGQWTSSIPSRFIEELPDEQIDAETTMSGGESLWRANWSESDDPFAHVARDKPERSSQRGPGWQRAVASGYDTKQLVVKENRRSAASFAAKPRADIAVGQRVFHDKFGYGFVMDQEGNKLEIEFETSGLKRVIDSFVKAAE